MKLLQIETIYLIFTDFEHEIPDLDTGPIEAPKLISVRKDLFSGIAQELPRNNSPCVAYNCDLCQYSAKSIQSLSIHKKMTHGSPMIYACDACPKTFDSNEVKITHMNDVHGGIDRTYPCNKCKKSFNSDRKLRDHVDIRHNTRKRKRRTRHGTRLVCTLCDSRFGSKIALERHNLSVHGVHNIR